MYYTRFSTTVQADGGSLGSQTRLTQKYCERHGHKMGIVHALARKDEAGNRKRYVYLAPFGESALAGGPRFDYTIFESAILTLLRELKPSDITGPDAKATGQEGALSGGHLERVKGGVGGNAMQ